MFTLEQIKAAHSKVKSGADFPAYVQDLVQLGVVSYEIQVSNNRAIYYSNGSYSISTPDSEPLRTIADMVQHDRFRADLKAHQQGLTDYLTFCKDCATSGIAKWIVNTHDKTCTYFDQSGVRVLEEKF